ncbi:phosphatidylinositol-glycan-specific phospholipase D-like [Magallana gigas]|uniref:phosphatidylinositol-glycan-specific phospholipase D-like n=1 Tax=Magallana gigas TaxID=29159 RepID=UPI003340ADF2
MSASISSTLVKWVLLSQCICLINGYGSISHGIISYRASVYFGDEETQKIVQENPDGLFGGSVYPDVFYDSQCSEGNYSFVSDATKSTAFLNASINYLLQKYPKPWNNASSLISNV